MLNFRMESESCKMQVTTFQISLVPINPLVCKKEIDSNYYNGDNEGKVMTICSK